MKTEKEITNELLEQDAAEDAKKAFFNGKKCTICGDALHYPEERIIKTGDGYAHKTCAD